MIPVYICEDEQIIRDKVQREIEKYIMIQNYDMQVMLSTADPEELINHIRNREERGVYFLDVDLKHERLDGFELGKQIRECDAGGFISYVTSFGNMAVKTFQYHIEALDYIVKDRPDQMIDNICRCLDTIVTRMQDEVQDEQNEYFTVKAADTIKHIPLSDIYCFETSGRTHRIVLYTANEMIDFIGKLQEIEEQLSGMFIRTHRAFLVNMEKVRELNTKKNELILENGQCCLMSRKTKPVIVQYLKQAVE